MANQNLLKLKTVELYIRLLTNSYQTVHETYLQNIKLGDKNKMNINANELDQINNALVAATSEGQILIDQSIKLGHRSQKLASNELPHMTKVINHARKQQIKLRIMEDKLLDATGELEYTSQAQHASSIQLTLIFIVSIIVVGYTFKTFTSRNISFLDNAIMALIIGLIIYFIIKKIG